MREKDFLLYNNLLSSAQCFPVHSLLLALNVSHVDVFILDVERVERNILENFPFDAITVDVWAIEHFTMRMTEDVEFIRFMIGKGYYYLDVLCSEVQDYIFVRKKSDTFKRLAVPKEKIHRDKLCPFKSYHNRLNYSMNERDLRDPHHFPSLVYNSNIDIKFNKT